jgi:CubicO group peptidase (beta-lactamase class C family)
MQLESLRTVRLTLSFVLSLAITAMYVCLPARAEIPTWVVYPETEWKSLSPEEAGIRDVAAWNRWVESTRKTAKGSSFQGEDHRGNKWGVAVTREGYLIQTFGDPDYKYQTASTAKAFVQACLQLAIDKGRIENADELIKNHWTGHGQLNSRHKYMDEGHHNDLTFNHLKNHTGAFAITNGHSWMLLGKNYEKTLPPWAKCTRDPDHDNYAQATPGTVGKQYSSGGYWRLAQALTAVWDKDLKTVMDENLFTHMGIAPDDWDWLPGRVVHDSRNLYPKMPNYGLFVDPPYEINGHIVRTGGTGVVMNAKDLARYGLLVATGGIWKSKRLISNVVDAGGGNGSAARGYRQAMGSRGDVTTTMKQTEVPWHLFKDPPRPK